jgi:hypothetical protein
MAAVEPDLVPIRREALRAIAALASEYKEFISDARIVQDDPLTSSRQKLQLDVHTMAIDQNARKLLRIIQSIKEFKVTDDSHQEQRQQFEGECIAATQHVQSCIIASYDTLTALADEGFRVRQEASKLLR